ncbi:UDP-glucose 4-epimerase [candidate division KSB1 bacterium]|nr:MAG: UDP-glucose 4-epimerase [candidate division KSB1 bacterium]
MNMIKEKAILVTGGAGFIGSHLVDALLARGAGAVVVVDNLFLGSLDNLAAAQQSERFHFYREDAVDLSIMDHLMAKHRVEIVFNLATKALLYSFTNPEGAFMVNVEIMRALLYLQRKGAFKTLIHCSSSEAYGTAQTFPMDENHPYVPATPYAAGKAAADLMALSYAHTFGAEVAVIRPFNNYGPRQNKERGLEAVIPLTAARLMRGEMPVIYGDGEQTRDFIYVADTVNGLLLAYEKPAARGQVINLASGKEISIAEVVRGICAYFNYDGLIEYREARPADVRRHRGDIQRAQKILGFTPQVNFDDGLRRTLDWYTKS